MAVTLEARRRYGYKRKRPTGRVSRFNQPDAAGDSDMTDTGSEPSNQATAAHFALVAAIRDNVFLEDWALDELLDAQPDGTHAKQLLVALAVLGIAPEDAAGIVMTRDGLSGE